MEKDKNTMLHSLFKFKKVLASLVIGLCLALILCPLQTQAAENPSVTVKSPSNPDCIFTGDEVYDLTVYLQGNANETYYISFKVIDSRKLTLKQSKDPIAVTLSGDGCGELLLDLSSIKGRDTFRLEITVVDSSGASVGDASCNFSRVAKDSVFSTVANVRNGVLFSTDETRHDRYLYLKKEDHFPETLTVVYWITDDTGHILRQFKGQVAVPTKDYASLPLNFYGLEAYGLCRISYAVYDDTNNLRSSGITYCHHYGSEYITGTLSSAQNQLGMVFANDEPYDIFLELQKTDNYAENFSVQYAVTDSFGSVVKEFSNTLSLPAKETVTVPLDLSDVTGYGLFSLTATITDQFGHENDLTFHFSRVLATTQPGDLPLVNINDHFTTNNGDPNMKLELAAQAGFALWRSSIPWASVEKNHGIYTMPVAVDEVMATTENLGMAPLIILAYGNDTLYGQPDPTNPTWLEAYANYCKYIASYFGDRVTYYEIWNEWNHSTMGKTAPNRKGGNYYAMALVAASKAIKSVNPNAKIIGGAMAGHNEDWMTAMLSYDGNGDGKSDAMEAMDGFSFHAYNTDWVSCFYSPWEQGYFESYDEVISVLNRFGDASTKEIWMTETGWSTALGPGVTEEEQGAYTVQMYIWALANPDKVDRIFWYDLMNDRDAQTIDWDPAAGEHNWGLIHSWTNTGDEPLAYSAKKSYAAVCAMTSIMAGATDGSAYDLGEGVYAYQFRKDGQDLLVVWMDGESKTINLSFSGDLVVYDMYGNATTYTGTAALTASDCPIYLECAPGAITSIG